MREVNDERHVFVDYMLRQVTEDDPSLKLRSQEGRCLLLQAIDAFGFDQAFKDVLEDSTERFVVHNADNTDDVYARLNGTNFPWFASISAIGDQDRDGKMTGNDRLIKTSIYYWDFVRDVKDEAGQTYEEFLFVEMDQDSGWFTLWRGREIHPSQVQVV
jgi:hypothetical protein